MSKKIMLMRHGKSSWKDKELKDFDRPLKKKGHESSEKIGKLLKASGMLPDLIFSSPAKRASETAEIVAKEIGHDAILYVDSFYMGEPEDYITPLKELTDDVKRVLIIGHNPGLEALLQVLEGKVNVLSTGALACLELELKKWKNLNPSTVGELVTFWDPDEIDLDDALKEIEKSQKEKKDKKEKKEKKDKKEK